MILLDTNALIWLETGHARSRVLVQVRGGLRISPASLLELQFLLELGRLRMKTSISDLAEDSRWIVDEPPVLPWFEEAFGLTWTRDPFDRLIVAHALSRGWKLATGDVNILEHLDRRHALAL
ncbi:MAG: PIN domain-containing protein [Deltaproteobacteria bacterium]|nr:PIN domain-containing protein [Deltaproteobacteria bacterium]